MAILSSPRSARRADARGAPTGEDSASLPHRLAQLGLWAAGVSGVAWALVDQRWRDAEASLQGSFVLPLAAGIALLVLGLATVQPGWLRWAGLFALALLGQAAALQLVDAGTLLHFQHYLALPQMVSERPLALAIVVAQAAVVVVALRTRWAAVAHWLRQRFGLWQLAGLGLVLALPTAALARDLSSYAAELAIGTVIQGVSLANVVLMARAMPPGGLAPLTRLFGREEAAEEPRRGITLDRVAALAAAWVVVLAASLSFFVYERHPHVPDEALYLYQARYLAEGRLMVPAPNPAEAFSIYMIPDRSAQWYSPFPPAWPAALAVGLRLGAPWLVNPLLAGLNVVLAYAIVWRVYGRGTARLVVLLLSASPWHIFTAMSFMSHTFTLTCVLAAAAFILKGHTSGRAIWAGLAGGAVGLVALTRPLDGAITGGMLGAAVLGAALGSRGLRAGARSMVAFAAAATAVGGLMLPYNAIVTGSPTVHPLEAYYDLYFWPNANAYGFGPERGLGWALDAFPGHSAAEAVLNAALNAFSVNVELFGWGMGSLLPIGVLVLSRRASRRDYVLLAIVGVVVVAYGGYWFHGGPDFGARYWFLVLIPCVALAARGMQVVAEWLADEGRPATARVNATVISLCLACLATYIPWRAADKYHHYLNMRPDISQLAAAHHFGRSLVLVRGESHPDYVSAWVFNPLDLNAAVPVYAWDRDTLLRQQVLNAYPDRPVWLVNGPSLTNGAYQLVAGPLSADELRAAEDGN